MSSVSVVIPCYRYGHFLADAVHSVLEEQDGVDVRVLVIDDASPDDSADVARAIAARDPRVEVLAHETNKGHIATYNEGLLGWADGDYTVLMSADDRLTPGALTRAAALLDAHPEVGFVYGNVLWFSDGAPLPRPRTVHRGWSTWPGHRWLESRYRLGQSGISSPEVVVRTSVQRQVGGYDPRLPHLGDTHMWLRFAARADVGYVRGSDQAYYRRHLNNMSVAYSALDTFTQYLSVFDAVLDEYEDVLSGRDRLSQLVRRRLAREALIAAGQAHDGGPADQEVDQLVAFAEACWPGAGRLPAYQSLAVRRRLGPAAVPYLKPLGIPATAARKVEASWVRRDEQSVGEQVRRWWLRQRAVRVQGRVAQSTVAAVSGLK